MVGEFSQLLNALFRSIASTDIGGPIPAGVAALPDLAEMYGEGGFLSYPGNLISDICLVWLVIHLLMVQFLPWPMEEHSGEQSTPFVPFTSLLQCLHHFLC